RQHRDDDLEGRLVRDAKAVHLTLLEARGLQRGVDLLAAAVDDGDRRARGNDRGERAHDTGQVRAILEELSPELDYQRTGNHQRVLTTEDAEDTEDRPCSFSPLCP